jgi:hypothetical protein
VTCSNLPDSYFSLEGSVGGLNSNQQPWFCGGVYHVDTRTVCLTYNNWSWGWSWGYTASLVYQRAYSGISQLGKGKYLITGGVRGDGQTVTGTEMFENNAWRSLTFQLPSPLYKHCQVLKIHLAQLELISSHVASWVADMFLQL